MYYLIRDTPFEMIPSSLIDNPLDEDTPDQTHDHTHSFMKLLRYDEHQVDIESLLYWDKQNGNWAN